MKFARYALLFAIPLLSSLWIDTGCSRTTAAEAAVPLVLVRALPVEGPADIQPSGLTIIGDTLFSVSDKHDGIVYRIELGRDRAAFVPHMRFHVDPPTPEIGRLDFEGITHDGAGNFYIVSESTFGVLKLDTARGQATWLVSSVRRHGEGAGLFKTKGAGLEGVAFVRPGLMLVCAERQPRGLLEVDTNETPYSYRAFEYDDTVLELPPGRKPDFTGMYSEGADLYALIRNADAVCRINYGTDGLVETDLWSYSHIVSREDLRYSDMRFGMAEGLCMDANHIYIILDNNGDYRPSARGDSRPLLLIFKRPPSGRPPVVNDESARAS